MRAQLVVIALVLGLLVPTATPAAAHAETGVMMGTMTFSPALTLAWVPGSSGSFSLDATTIGIPSSSPVHIDGTIRGLGGLGGPVCGAAEGSDGAGVLGHHAL